ncbi:MAG: hypothetical protein MZV70_77645 [Desulfobacterales bacterium]|nr:hypothetical protein [Desulfobacterales bacterium]
MALFVTFSGRLILAHQFSVLLFGDHRLQPRPRGHPALGQNCRRHHPKPPEN